MSEIFESRKQLAADRAEQIRLGLQSSAVLYAAAITEEDWKVLSYASEKAWAAAEFSPDRFSTENRKRLVAMYGAWGWSQRQIAAATGASQSTVKRDQQEARESDDSQETDPPEQDLLTSRQRAAREREVQRARQREVEREAAAARELENQRRRDALAAGVAREREAAAQHPQGNTADAQAEIRKRVRSREPIQRGQLASEFGVSEMFVRGSVVAEGALWQAELAAEEEARVALEDLERERMRSQHVLAEWAEAENTAIAMFRNAPAVVLDDLVRRLADLRRAL